VNKLATNRSVSFPDELLAQIVKDTPDMVKFSTFVIMLVRKGYELKALQKKIIDRAQ